MAGLIARVVGLDGRRIAVVVALGNTTLFTMMMLAMWVGWGGLESALAVPHSTWDVVASGLAITALEAGCGLLVVVGVFAFQPHRRTWLSVLLIVGVVSLVLSLPRIAVLFTARTTPSTLTYLVTEWGIGFIASIVIVTTSLIAGLLVDRVRSEERRRKDESLRAARAIEELQAEETRVRQMVADQLHGSLQFQLVAVTAGLEALARQLVDTGVTTCDASLHELIERVERIREEEVRSLSYTVFPSGADIGTPEAIAILLDRLPPSVNPSIKIGPAYRRLIAEDGSPMAIPERLIAVYTIEEAVSNALRHGHSRTICVTAEAVETPDPCGWILDVTIEDDGRGLASEQPVLGGLERHRARLEARGGSLRLERGSAGGTRLRFTLPFERPNRPEGLTARAGQSTS